MLSSLEFYVRYSTREMDNELAPSIQNASQGDLEEINRAIEILQEKLFYS